MLIQYVWVVYRKNASRFFLFVFVQPTHFYSLHSVWDVQGGEDPQDALSLPVISRKRALRLVTLLWKMTCNLRHPMSFRHPVCVHRESNSIFSVYNPHILNPHFSMYNAQISNHNFLLTTHPYSIMFFLYTTQRGGEFEGGGEREEEPLRLNP